MPQAQDPMVLLGELVKALNLYSNIGVGNHSNVNNMFMYFVVVSFLLEVAIEC